MRNSLNPPKEEHMSVGARLFLKNDKKLSADKQISLMKLPAR